MVWWGSPYTHPVPGRRPRSHPSSRSAMGEMEQLGRKRRAAQEADAVTPEPSIPPGDMGKPGTQWAPGEGLASPLIDISETPDLEVPRDFLNLEPVI